MKTLLFQLGPVTHCSRAPANTAPPKNKKSKKSFRIIPSIFFEVSYLKDNNKILIHSLNRQNITLPFRHPGRQQGAPPAIPGRQAGRETLKKIFHSEKPSVRAA